VFIFKNQPEYYNNNYFIALYDSEPVLELAWSRPKNNLGKSGNIFDMKHLKQQ
jgi:hypothetical protein